MINKELLQLTLDTIKANPQHWAQTHWHCGTTHCFAGFAELLGMGLSLDTKIGELQSNDSIYWWEGEVWKTCTNAQEFLGLSDNQASALFDSNNTLGDLEDIVGVLMDTED